MVERLAHWCKTTALPVWADAGFDSRRRRFHERLDFQAVPLCDVPIRSMVQARQIYVMAEAARLGWFDDGGDLALGAMRSLQRDFCTRSQGRTSCAFSIDASGRVVSDRRDAYTHAFILFASASLYRLTGDETLLDFADDVIAFIDHELADPDFGGTWSEAPVVDRVKRQNPHMHLLEAYLALAAAAPSRSYLQRAHDLVQLFQTKMYDESTASIGEFFAADWGPADQPNLRKVIEPGHQFEWSWLLDRFGRLTGGDCSLPVAPLYRTGRDNGLFSDGLIHDELDASLRPTKRSTRLWPHAEALKAAAVMHERGSTDARAFAARISAAMGAAFLDRPFRGGWIDHLSAERLPLVAYVPASSLYHLFFAATELTRVFSKGASDMEPATSSQHQLATDDQVRSAR